MPSKSPRQTMDSPAPALFPSSGKATTDKAASACAEWLAQNSEQENLAKRWQRLESHLINKNDWFQLSERQRAALPEAAQLQAINDRLDELDASKQRLLVMLPKTATTTTHGLACKLSVALALVHPEENEEAHTLLLSVMKDLQNSVLTITE